MTSGDHQRKSDEPRRPPTLRPVEGSVPPKPTKPQFGVTKLLFAFRKRHRGKALELDASHDTLRVLGPQGEELAVVDSDVALDHLLGRPPEAAAPSKSEGAGPFESAPRRLGRLRVTARGNDGRHYEGQCPVLGRGGLFLELTQAPVPGTRLELTLMGEEDGSRSLRLKGTVAWICPHPDEFGLAPGVGVTGTAHEPELAALLSLAGAPERP